MYSTVILYTILLAFLAKWLWSRRHLYRLSLELPGPTGLPFIGSALQLVMRKIDKDNVDNLQFLGEMVKNYGPTMKMWFGSKIYIFINRRENIETVLTSSKCPNRSDDAKHLETLFDGNGLLTAKVDTFHQEHGIQNYPCLRIRKDSWSNNLKKKLNAMGTISMDLYIPHSKRHRRIVSPYFNANSVKDYVPCFNKNALAIVKELQDMTGINIDIRSCIFTAVVRSFAETTMSSDSDPKFIENLRESITESDKILSALFFKPWYHLSFIWNLSSYKRSVDRIKKQMNEMANNKILRQDKEGSSNVNILERLIREATENPKFKHESIRLEISTIVSTTETTTIATAFSLILLAMNPEWQEIVFQEIETILPNNIAELTKSDLNKMINVDMCIKETVRLFPAVPVFSRNVDQTMKIGKYTIPAGVGVMISAFHVNRNPDYWGTDSNDYNPKRFAPENLKNILPYSFLTFGEGPRNCFGSMYAQTIIKIFLIHIVKCYKMTTSLKYDNLKVYSLVGLKLVGPFLVQLHPRKG